jgi:hypothetical protein
VFLVEVFSKISIPAVGFPWSGRDRANAAAKNASIESRSVCWMVDQAKDWHPLPLVSGREIGTESRSVVNLLLCAANPPIRPIICPSQEAQSFYLYEVGVYGVRRNRAGMPHAGTEKEQWETELKRGLGLCDTGDIFFRKERRRR